MRKKVCIVTPDIIGPIKNGGMGTHAYYFAQELAKENYDVKVLFTSICENRNKLYWLKYYEKLNIEYIQVEDLDKPNYPLIFSMWFLDRSYIIYQYLRKNKFDFIHFQDWHANGFHTIQAKRNTNEFENTLITVTMHSSTRWLKQGMKIENKNSIPDSKLEWCERYCCKNCDLLISPSKHMFNWAIENDWELAEKKRVMPYCFENILKKDISYGINLKHLIFFGRLETRKGLELFCDSIIEILQNKLDLVEKISFVGKIGQINNISAEQYINSKFCDYEIDYNIYSKFDTFKAMEYISDQKGVVVIPSLLDNYPYTIIECIENNISFIVSSVGGIPEMVDEAILFEPNVKSLVNKIKNLHNIVCKKLNHKYKKGKAAREWLEIHERKNDILNSALCDDINRRIEKENPLVSICVSYYNYGRYIDQLLESIANSSYKNYEVIVVNDGSKEELSNIVFDNMKKRYLLPNWKFFNKSNGGTGSARNYAVEKSKGNYIIFMDADNIATFNMIYDFLYGLYKSGADCLACHCNTFKSENGVTKDTNIEYKYIPIGPVLEVGKIENVFGDANFVIKREVFCEIGGFLEAKNITWEDWSFLIELNLLGYKQDVIPKELFWYRLHDKNFSKTSDKNKNYQYVLKAYSKHPSIKRKTEISC